MEQVKALETDNSVNMADQSMIEAINLVQAVIEFDLDGIVLSANQNFLDTMGYSLAEIKGQYHQFFVMMTSIHHLITSRSGKLSPKVSTRPGNLSA